MFSMRMNKLTLRSRRLRSRRDLGKFQGSENRITVLTNTSRGAVFGGVTNLQLVFECQLTRY